MRKLQAALGVGEAGCAGEVEGFGFVRVKHMRTHVRVHHEHMAGATGRPSIHNPSELADIVRNTVQRDDSEEALIVRADATEGKPVHCVVGNSAPNAVGKTHTRGVHLHENQGVDFLLHPQAPDCISQLLQLLVWSVTMEIFFIRTVILGWVVSLK
jgi:hypothetical protein